MKSTNCPFISFHRATRAAIFLILTLSFLHAKAYTVDNISYDLDETKKTATVGVENASMLKSANMAITIPATIEKDGVTYTVTAIADGALAGSGITGITIEAQLTSLPNNCFQGCPNLVSVSLPETVKTIPNYAFENCKKLTTVNLENITQIGNYAFKYCVLLPCPDFSKITRVGEYAFSYCTGLGEIVLPTNTYFYEGSFQNTAPTKITFLKNSTTQKSFGRQLFFFSKLPQSIEFPEFLSSIPGFGYSTGLKSIDLSKLSDKVSIPAYGFHITSLTTVKFPPALNAIGEAAFWESGITEVTLPNLQRIHLQAFYKSKLEKIIWPENKIDQIDNKAFSETNVTSIDIPAWMTDIPKNLFFNCKSLTSLTLPEGLVSINEGAFSGCQISSIELPSTVTSIGVSAFLNNKIAALTIPDGVSTIAASAFKGNLITSLNIPTSITSLGNSAFEGNSIESLSFASSNENTHPTFGTRVFAGNKLTTFTFPTWMTTVPEGFFADNTALSSVTLATGTEQILADAFSGCTHLQIGDFPATISYFGKTSFYNGGSELAGDNYLGSINIIDGITVEANAFQNARLKGVNFKTCSYSLGDDVFSGVTSVSKISFPECMTEIPAGICRGWTNLTEVGWPPVITSIGDYAFYGCTNLNFGSDDQGHNNVLDLTKWPFNNYVEGGTLNLGEGCFGGTTIDHIVWPEDNTGLTLKAVVAGDEALKEVTIPAWMNLVPSNMFLNCTNLETVNWEIDSWTDEDWATSKYGSRSAYTLTIDQWGLSNTGLKTLRWPNVTTILRKGALNNNSKATKIEWDKSGIATLAGDFIFAECKLLTEPTTVPDYVKNIPRMTFSGCHALPEFTIPQTVTSTGNATFYNCKGLKTVKVECDIAALPDSLFCECPNLTKITLANPIKKIGAYCFYECSKLTGIAFNNGNEKLTNIGKKAFYYCSKLAEFPDIIDNDAIIQSNAFSLTYSLKHLSVPSNAGKIGDNLGYTAAASGLESIDILKHSSGNFEFYYFSIDVNPKYRGVSTCLFDPVTFDTYRRDRVNYGGILLVNRNQKYRFINAQYNRLWDIVEKKAPVLTLQGDIYSKFTPGERVNHYTTTLLWEICECDLDQTKPTEYEVYRDGELRAKVTIGTKQTLPSVNDGTVVVNSPTTAYPVTVKMIEADGSEKEADMSGFSGEVRYQTGENSFTQVIANQHSNLYFNPTTSERLGVNKGLGDKSWFIFFDRFDSPDLDELDVPSSYTYTVKLKSYDYQEPRNNAGYAAGADGKYWHYETFTLGDVVSKPCTVYTSMAVPSLTFGGTYTREDIMNDTQGTLTVTQPIADNGAVSVTYAFADPTHVEHKLDSKPIIDHITSYEIGLATEPGFAEWKTINIKGDTSLAEGEMIVPADKNAGVGSSFQLVTSTLGRGTFGSRVVTIPGAPRFSSDSDIEIKRSFIYGEGHNHNTVVRQEITLTPDVTEMDFNTPIPPKSHHFIGVWRTIKRTEVNAAQAARRAMAAEDGDATDPEEELIHFNGEDFNSQSVGCSTCDSQQGYKAGSDKCVYTDNIMASPTQADIAAKYRVRMYVQTPYDKNQWMVSEATVENSGIVTGIPNIGIDSDTPIYYNLQGIQVVRPQEGEIVIRVDRTGSHRIRYSEE